MSTGRILVVDDEADIRGLLKEILSEEGYDVDVAADAGQARASRARATPDLVLLDIWMPDTDGITLLREWSTLPVEDCPVVMMSGHGTVETAVEATRLGAFDYVEKPLSLSKLLRTVERAMDAGKRRRLTARAHMPPLLATFGKSRITQQLRAELTRVAPLSAPLLLVGEPGSGREALARFTHESGPRAARAFVMLVSSAVPDENAERFLCGDAATADAPGQFDQAQGGTLFIHEIEDLSPRAQRVLLGAIETGSYTRVGGTQPLPFNARIIATTQPGAEDRLASSGLRRDLLAHLSALLVRVPPLREYAEDVPELLRFYVDRMVDAEQLPFRRFSVAAQNRLRNYPWPDNLRQLRSLVRRMLIKGGPEEIHLDEIETELAANAPSNEPLVKQDLLALPLREAREHFERAYLQQQLLLCNGKVGQLAKRVDMERTHLYRKLRSLGVDFRHTTDD
ncbi:MAG: sigma-54 dependent transcriptional regulator [Nevskiaceae bacterium]|jgi:DNA-binding NtrC family response regulator|nr:sigma-54 dependent transcriptional regulator [Nevskiaceae bacterium]